MSVTDNVKTEMVTVDGNDYWRVTLENEVFDLPFKMISGNKVAFLDISGQVRLIEKSADLIVKKLKEENVTFDTILNPVAKSNALAHAIAVRWAKENDGDFSHTVVARKSKGGEHHCVEASYKSVTTSVEQSLYITEDDVKYMKGKNILLVDDVYGGGGTTRALISLVEQAGSKVSGHAVCAVEENGKYPEGLVYLYTLPVL